MAGRFPATFTPLFPGDEPATTPGGWDGLLGIIDDARQTADAERNTPPVFCPNDGTRLETGPDGGLHCSWDGWRPAGLPPAGPSPW
jgi:hypothetical protein